MTRSSRVWMVMALLAALATTATSSCRHPKKFPSGVEEPDSSIEAPPTPALSGAPLSPEELSAAETSCRQFVEAVCACASKQPTFTDRCERARGQVDAIKLHVAGLAAATDAGVPPRVMFQSIREIARACSEDLAAFACK